eukprot:7516754-Lingulodinium_polyedra.AAC.1
MHLGLKPVNWMTFSMVSLALPQGSYNVDQRHSKSLSTMCVKPSRLATGPFPRLPVLCLVKWMWSSGTPNSRRPSCFANRTTQ